jgi:hypothetical protein
MSGISFLGLAAGSGAGASEALTGVFGVSLMERVYTTQRVKRGVIQTLPGKNAPGMFSGTRCRSGNRWIL